MKDSAQQKTVRDYILEAYRELKADGRSIEGTTIWQHLRYKLNPQQVGEELFRMRDEGLVTWLGPEDELRLEYTIDFASGNTPISIDLVPVIETIEQLTPSLITHLKSHEEDIDKLRWDVFEHLVAEFLASSGFKDVRLVGRSSVTSADIFAAYTIDSIGTKVRYFIEVKRWKNKVGVEIIDQVYGAMLNERSQFGWHAAMIVSLVGFKDFRKYNRVELALKGIELKERDDLLRWLNGYKPNKDGLWLPEPHTDLQMNEATSK